MADRHPTSKQLLEILKDLPPNTSSSYLEVLKTLPQFSFQQSHEGELSRQPQIAGFSETSILFLNFETEPVPFCHSTYHIINLCKTIITQKAADFAASATDCAIYDNR